MARVNIAANATITISRTNNTVVTIARNLKPSARGELGMARYGVYSPSKAAVNLLTKSLGCEWGPHKINVNAIAPGYIETPMTEVLPEKVKEELKRLIPMERLGKPEDVAEAVLFLVSEESNYITGHVLKVNGGIYM